MNIAVFHREQEVFSLQSASLLRMTSNHARHPTANADAGNNSQRCLPSLNYTLVLMAFPRSNWVSRHQKGETFWILMK